MSYLLVAGSGAPAASGSIHGKLHAHRHGSSATQDLTFSFADDNGACSPTGTHWFCGATDYYERPSESEDVAGQLRAYGITVIRNFRVLGYDWVDPNGPDVPPPSGSYFGMRGVSPVHIDRVLDFVEMLARHDLYVQSTAGHQWNSSKERIAWEIKFWTRAVERGLLKRFLLAEGDNEYVQQAHMRDSDEQIREYKQLYDFLKSLGPDRPLFACGAALSESPADVRRSLGEIRSPRNADDDDPHQVILPQFCDYLDTHTSRDETPGVDETIKRPFSLGYNEGHVGAYGVPIAFSEPRGYLGPASFSPSDKPGRIVGGYGAGKLWGGLVTHFSGESVRGESRFNSEMRPSNLLTAEGVDKVAKLLNNLPRNVGESGHVKGGNIWWWDLPDGRIATVCSELWPDTSRGEPIKAPVPIEQFLVIGPHWEAREYQGNPTMAHLRSQGGAMIVAVPA